MFLLTVACASVEAETPTPEKLVTATPTLDLNKLRNASPAEYALLGIGERTGGAPEGLRGDSPALPIEQRIALLADFLPGVQFVADATIARGIRFEFCHDGETGYYYEAFGQLPAGTEFEWSLTDEIPDWAKGVDWIHHNTTTIVMQDVAGLYPPVLYPMSSGTTDDSDPDTGFTAYHDNC